MKFLLAVSYTAILTFSQLDVISQNKRPEGFFTSEANIITEGDRTFVSIKKYNPTQKEVLEAGKPFKTGELNFLSAPFSSTNISMYQKGFESKIYCLDNTGNIVWDYTIGYSNQSVASPIKWKNGYIYTGESNLETDKVILRKMDKNGNVVWKTELDSLHAVNDILIEGDRVSALVSFNTSKKNDNPANGTFYHHTYPVYFFAQFDITSGRLIKKEYQRMANYLSSKDFTGPQLNSDYSYYLSNQDSAIFLTVMKQDGATVVSQGMSKDKKIITMTSGPESYHLLTALASSSKNVYILISDFYGKGKKYEIELPVKFAKDDRRFLYRTSKDSIVTVIGNKEASTVLFTDTVGHTTIKKFTSELSALIVGVAISNNRICLAYVEGRNTPGSTGRLKLFFLE